MICYVLAMGKQHLGPHAVVGYGIKFFWPGLFITSPDHLVKLERQNLICFPKRAYQHRNRFTAFCAIPRREIYLLY